MAGETKAEIVFTTGGKLEVQETPDQIKNGIGGATSPHIPLVKVTDADGVEHWINALEIVDFYAPVTRRSATFT